MSNNEIFDFSGAAGIIKDAIIRSRYQAATLVNKELLSLYYAVGRYVSENSRNSIWGQGAIKYLSQSLQSELPGLRGFSEVSIKRMRLFYENWHSVFINRPLATDDFTLIQNSQIEQSENSIAVINTSNSNEPAVDLSLLAKHLSGFAPSEFSADMFFKVGFILIPTN